MEIEKDNTIPFLDTTVTWDSDGLLNTTVYRKSTHTDQYLAYDSHNPQSVKRGIVKRLYYGTEPTSHNETVNYLWRKKLTLSICELVNLDKKHWIKRMPIRKHNKGAKIHAYLVQKRFERWICGKWLACSIRSDPTQISLISLLHRYYGAVYFTLNNMHFVWLTQRLEYAGKWRHCV